MNRWSGRIAPSCPTATNLPWPLVIPNMLLAVPAFRAVQVIPSGLVITRLVVSVDGAAETATNCP